MKFPIVSLLAGLAASLSGASAFLAPASSTSAVQGVSAGVARASALTAMARGQGYGPPLDNISEAIGNTPLVKISDRLCPPGRTLYAKCEYFNPLSSVKDRLALSVIEAAERDGTLRPGMTVVEATSGNTGIAVAMMCAQRGYPCVITMAEPFSVERRKLMRMLGAKVIVTPKAGKGTGMVEKAAELAEVSRPTAARLPMCARHRAFTLLLPACAEARVVPLPPVRDGRQLADALRHDGARDPERPRRPARLLGHRLRDRGDVPRRRQVPQGALSPHPDRVGRAGRREPRGERHSNGAEGGREPRRVPPGLRGPSHPRCVRERPRAVVALARGAATIVGTLTGGRSLPPSFPPPPLPPGWTPDFIPLVLEKGLEQTLHDEMVEIPDGAAVAMAQSLARNEGILTGISGEK